MDVSGFLSFTFLSLTVSHSLPSYPFIPGILRDTPHTSKSLNRGNRKEKEKHSHKDNLRHLPRFPGLFVTLRILSVNDREETEKENPVSLLHGEERLCVRSLPEAASGGRSDEEMRNEVKMERIIFGMVLEMTKESHLPFPLLSSFGSVHER